MLYDQGYLYIGVRARGCRLAIGRSLQVNSFLAKTSTPGLEGKDVAFYGRIAYRDLKWNRWLNYRDVERIGTTSGERDEADGGSRSGVRRGGAPRAGKCVARAARISVGVE